MSEKLLYALTARGKMSISGFDSAFNALYGQVTTNHPAEVNFHELRRQTIRFLDGLGHCEFDFEKRFVYVCEPTLVLLPNSGLPRAILAGARTPALISKLKTFSRNHKESVDLSMFSQDSRHFLLPAAVCMEAINNIMLEEAASFAGLWHQLDAPAAHLLLNFSCDIRTMKGNMSLDHRAAPNWPKRTFAISNLSFLKYFTPENELKLVEYTSPIDQQRLHWLWDGDKAAEIDRDWGRFLILWCQNINIVLYDSKKFLLGIPATVPLPRLIARAVTLCTGLAPVQAVLSGKPFSDIPESCFLDVYQAVFPSIAEIVSEKLGQRFISSNLEIDVSG